MQAFTAGFQQSFLYPPFGSAGLNAKKSKEVERSPEDSSLLFIEPLSLATSVLTPAPSPVPSPKATPKATSIKRQQTYCRCSETPGLPGIRHTFSARILGMEIRYEQDCRSIDHRLQVVQRQPDLRKRPYPSGDRSQLPPRSVLHPGHLNQISDCQC